MITSVDNFKKGSRGMSKSFKVIVQTIENNEIVSESVIIKDDLRGKRNTTRH